jgi:hypothetical protein
VIPVTVKLVAATTAFFIMPYRSYRCADRRRALMRHASALARTIQAGVLSQGCVLTAAAFIAAPLAPAASAAGGSGLTPWPAT